MKNLILLAALLLSINLIGQDIITKKNGSIVEAIITEDIGNAIKYKAYDNPNGPEQSLLKVDIATIKYENQQGGAVGDINPRADRRFGINLGASLSGLISIDYFVTPSFKLEIGMPAGIGAGFQYHINGSNATKRWTPFIGAYYAYVQGIFSSSLNVGYFPIGMQYVGSKGFSFGVELGPVISGESETCFFGCRKNKGGASIAPGIKIGYHF